MLTFDQWYNWWLSNGIDKNLPAAVKSKQTLCMCRFNDTGAYDLSNIYCATVTENVRDAHRFRKTPNDTNLTLPIKNHGKMKPIHTPIGDFKSRKEAIIAYNVDRTTFARWLKLDPNNFYYP